MTRLIRSIAAPAVTVLLALMAACESPREPALDPALWADFEERFVRAGRVIDSGNQDISHSEGQGYGMLFAVAAGDHAGFKALWRWTASVLQRDDGLLSWRYVPCPAANASCIDDPNNASDGDLLVAWALLRAGHKWNRPGYVSEAARILSAIERQLVVDRQGYTLLLPGATGFRHGDAITLNLSYWVFPALDAFRRQWPDGPWQALTESGTALVDEARFGPMQLPPDWLQLDATGLRPSAHFPVRYGFDAVRIPLYLSWAGLAPADGWRTLRQLWQRDPVPAWIDLSTGGTSDYAWSAGMQAVARLVVAGTDSGTLRPDPGPRAIEGADYYSYSLFLLSLIAAAERAA